MPDDEAIWRLLRERALREATPTEGAEGSQGPKRESVVSLLDAVLGVLGATRHLVEVVEGVVRDGRDRLAEPDGELPQTVPDQSRSERKRITLSY